MSKLGKSIAAGVFVVMPLSLTALPALADPPAGQCAAPFANKQGGESVRNGCGKPVKILCANSKQWKLVDMNETISCGRKKVTDVE
jgi:hypothetical protein